MDEPSSHQEIGPWTQLRLILFLLGSLYYITQNARDRGTGPKLRTPIRIIIIILLSMIMLFFDARPPSRVWEFRRRIFSALTQLFHQGYTVVTVGNAKKVVRRGLEPASWQTVIGCMKYLREQTASILQFMYRHLTKFVNNDLKPFIDNRIRPFVNDHLKPNGKMLAEQICRVPQNVTQRISITEHLYAILVSLEKTTIYGFCARLNELPNTLIAHVGHFWAYVLILLTAYALVLASRKIGRGVLRAYAIVKAFNACAVRVWRRWRWVVCTVLVFWAILAGLRHIIIVKGEEHFGNKDEF